MPSLSLRKLWKRPAGNGDQGRADQSLRPGPSINPVASRSSQLTTVVPRDSVAQSYCDNGDDCLKKGNYNAAATLYSYALKKTPDDAELLLYLSLARSMSTPPQLELALENVQDVIKQCPENAQAYISMADVCERLAKFDEAEVALLKAVDLTTGMSRICAHQLLANLREKVAQKQVPLESTSQMPRNTPTPLAAPTPSPPTSRISPLSSPTAPLADVANVASTLAAGSEKSQDYSSSKEKQPSTLSSPGLSVIAMGKRPVSQYTNSRYQYTDRVYSENQIRLLTLYPASRTEDTIECSLAIATLSSAKGSYDALSYVWGSQSILHQVIVNGCWHNVTPNLLEALRRLRHQTEPLVLWVDAICINQENNQEKNHQVRQMRNIYASASRVLILLGDSDADIDAVFEYVRRPKETRKHEIDAAFDILGGNFSEKNRPIEGFRKLCNKPWWTRMWVVQELIAATEDPLVICGNNSSDWAPICEAVGEVALDQVINKLVTSVVKDPLSTVFLYFGGPGSRDPKHIGKARTLESLLRGTMTHDATDPRDHVYALLGLVSGNTVELFEPDYARPAHIAYQYAMFHVFKTRQDLNHLTYAPGVQAVDTPSWCIDYSSKTWSSDATSNGLVVGSVDSRVTNLRRIPGEGASHGQGLTELVHDPDAGTIKVQGIRLGAIHSTVKSTTGVMRYMAPIHKSITQEELAQAPETDVTNLLADVFLFNFHACTALEKRYGIDEASRKLAVGDIWKVAAGGHDFNSLSGGETQQFNGLHPFGLLESVSQRLQPARADLLATYSEQLQPEPPGIDFVPIACEVFIKIALYTGMNSCYFTTDECDIGLAYNTVQKGDVLCILYGCKYPVVLRPQMDGTERYKFVAVSYVDSIMEGEYLINQDSARTEDFIIA